MSLSHAAQRAVTLITMDILLVAELTYTFSRCFSTQGDFSETFLTCYVPMFVPTVVIAFTVLWRIKRAEARDLETIEHAHSASE